MARPSYYTRGTIEVWDFIRDQELNYFLGNAIKYICRAGYKDCRIEDLQKAITYLEKELENVAPIEPSHRIPQRLQDSQLFEWPDETENLIVEEFKEFLDADQNMVLMHPQDREATLKELADLIYVCAQYAENMNWDIEQALRRVHRSNMSKLGEDGKPIYREDGKVLKGPNYQPPDLSDLV